VDYIEEYYDIIKKDINNHNNASKQKKMMNEAIVEQN